MIKVAIYFEAKNNKIVLNSVLLIGYLLLVIHI